MLYVRVRLVRSGGTGRIAEMRIAIHEGVLISTDNGLQRGKGARGAVSWDREVTSLLSPRDFDNFCKVNLPAEIDFKAS